MANWEYRVTKIKDDGGDLYIIAEVYYDEDGNIAATTVEPIGAMGLDITELAMDISMMAEALTKPVLDATDVDVTYTPDPNLELH